MKLVFELYLDISKKDTIYIYTVMQLLCLLFGKMMTSREMQKKKNKKHFDYKNKYEESMSSESLIMVSIYININWGNIKAYLT